MNEFVGGYPVVLRVRWVRSGFDPHKAYPHYEISVPRKLVERTGLVPGTRFFCYYYPEAKALVFVANPPSLLGRERGA